MPTDFIVGDLDGLEVIEKRAVALLAKKYAASGEAIKMRLSQLGIVGPYWQRHF